MSGANRRSREDWLRDIVLWGERLAGHLDGVTREAFSADKLRQDGAIRCIEVVGEASKQLMQAVPGIETTHPELDLKRAYATRIKIAHGYFATDEDIVWIAATVSVPRTVQAARALLNASQSDADGEP
ncbi:MAG: DUF86 domain-containing protein [Microvirga sp.]